MTRNKPSHPTLSRRRFLSSVGALGGSGAMYSAATALGLFSPVQAAAPGGFAMAPLGQNATKPRVAILGAGVGGLVAAYELDRAGYDVLVIEASGRIGGRNMTARRGTVIDEMGAPQVCDFDDDPNLYFNVGPARLHATHKRVLHYCRELGVELEHFVNYAPTAKVQSDDFMDGKPVLQREYQADAKGFLAEMAAKGVSSGQLDAPVGEEDLEKMVAFLGSYGDLSRDSLEYLGSERSGWASGGYLDPGVKKGTLPGFGELLKSPYWRFPMHFANGETQAPSMTQPVGGMDRIVAGFVRKVGDKVITNAQVTGLWLTEDGVRVDFNHGSKAESYNAEFCMNSIPGHLMGGLRHNLPGEMTALLGEMKGSKLSKIGLQMKSRFWEDEGIYGGISWSGDPIQQIWYPSHGIHSQKGVMLGAYIFAPLDNDRFAEMSHDERVEDALISGEKFHPGSYRANYETAVSLSWHRYNHMLGCGSGFGRGFSEAERAASTVKKKKLQKPVAGRYYMIGDQVSFHAGWQEGAIAISHQALADIEKQVAERYV